ncbi:MAG TPA: hypothetical protein VLB50_05170 [Ignavibacteriaceae bacterium]|nr:hypothetical protein [Ignavibacteriaceae bacterium]
MIPDELIKTNKAISRLRSDYEEYNSEEIKEVLDFLQYHLFLVITYFDKQEFDSKEVKERLRRKLSEEGEEGE